MPTALIVQTEHDGPAGLVADRLVERGLDLHVVQVLAPRSASSDVVFPDPTAFDLVVPLGSVHSVYDTATIGSWVGREIECIAGAHTAGVPVLGICFGAQVLCTALGGVVERSPAHELGWVQVDTADPARVPAGPWFTWHGDHCVVPDDVTVVARNDVCVQAFASGSSLGVQFHPEVTASIVRTWVDGCPPGVLAREGVEADALVASFERNGPVAAANVVTLVDRFLDEHVR